MKSPPSYSSRTEEELDKIPKIISKLQDLHRRRTISQLQDFQQQNQQEPRQNSKQSEEEKKGIRNNHTAVAKDWKKRNIQNYEHKRNEIENYFY
ncbi:hypothetical protein Taro_030852 [Colocasia esculenta]|uniref:Uncharacterized protein n=1 Tax=Colocasia esculenta TaxID=4460 RepID=A0A843VNG3_COLES|nr:hypothetical protein [Colocasia esculenta]